MKIKILSVGHIKTGPLKVLLNEYIQRCKWSIDLLELNHAAKDIESANILTKITDKDYVVLLDEGGKNISSQKFSQLFENLQNQSISTIIFVIGGAEGVNKSIKDRANLIIAFGEQTWPHMMARVMLAEQIYRAEQILKGHPYHKD